MGHWLDGVAKILCSPELDIVTLARLANVDPVDVYQYADLSKCDLRGLDLRSIDLTGAVLEGALLDSATKIASKFDPRINNKSYFHLQINSRLLRYINSEAHYAGYTYAIWFAKGLFEMMYNVRNHPQFVVLLDDLLTLELEHFFSVTNERYSRRLIQVPKYIINWLDDFDHKVLEEEKISFLLFACLIFRVQYRQNSTSATISELVEREEKFRKDRNYLSGF